MKINDPIHSEQGVPLSLDSEEDLQSYTTFLSSPDFQSLPVSSQARVLSAFQLTNDSSRESLSFDMFQDARQVPSDSKSGKSQSLPTTAQLRERKRQATKHQPASASNMYLRGFLVWFFCAIFGWVSIPTQFLPMITHAAGIGFFLVLVTSKTRWLWLVLSVLILLLVGSTQLPNSTPELGQLYHVIQASGYIAMAVTQQCVFFLCKPSKKHIPEEDAKKSTVSNEFQKMLLAQQSLQLEAIDKNRQLFLDTVESHQEAFRSTLTKQRDVLKQHWTQQLQFFFTFARDYGINNDSSSEGEELGDPIFYVASSDQEDEVTDKLPKRLKWIHTVRIGQYLAWQGIQSPLRPILLVVTISVHCLNKLARAIYIKYQNSVVNLFIHYVWRGMMLGLVVNMYINYVYQLWESLTRDIDNSLYSHHSPPSTQKNNTLEIPKQPSSSNNNNNAYTRKNKKHARNIESAIVVPTPVVHNNASQSQPTSSNNNHQNNATTSDNILPLSHNDIVMPDNIGSTSTNTPSHKPQNFLSPFVLHCLKQSNIFHTNLTEPFAATRYSVESCKCEPDSACVPHEAQTGIFFSNIKQGILRKNVPHSIQSIIGVLLHHDVHTPQLYTFFTFLLKSISITVENTCSLNILPELADMSTPHECTESDVCITCQLDAFGNFLRCHTVHLLNQVNLSTWIAHELFLSLRTYIVALNNTTKVAHTLGDKLKQSQQETSELKQHAENSEALKVVARQQAQKADKYKAKVEKLTEANVRLKNDVEFYRDQKTLSVQEQSNMIFQLKADLEQEKRTTQALQEKVDLLQTQKENDLREWRREKENNVSKLEEKDRVVSKKTKEIQKLNSHIDDLKRNYQRIKATSTPPIATTSRPASPGQLHIQQQQQQMYPHAVLQLSMSSSSSSSSPLPKPTYSQIVEQPAKTLDVSEYSVAFVESIYTNNHTPDNTSRLSDTFSLADTYNIASQPSSNSMYTNIINNNIINNNTMSNNTMSNNTMSNNAMSNNTMSNNTMNNTNNILANDLFPWNTWNTQATHRLQPYYTPQQQTHLDATAQPVLQNFWEGQATPLIDEYQENAAFDFDKFPSLRKDNTPIRK